MRHFILGLYLPLAVMGCTTVPAQQDAGNPYKSSDNDEQNVETARQGKSSEGLVFAQAHCAACHEVVGGEISPNPQARAFTAIANTRGLTDQTLTVWLNDSHNYPDLMDFEINARDIDNLAAYIVTLQSADYKPPIQ